MHIYLYVFVCTIFYFIFSLLFYMNTFTYIFAFNNYKPSAIFSLSNKNVQTRNLNEEYSYIYRVML